MTQYGFTERTDRAPGRDRARDHFDHEMLLVVCLRFSPAAAGHGQPTCAVVGDHFGPDQYPGTGNAIGPVKVESEGGSMRTFAGVGGTTVHYPSAGMTLHLPDPTEEVMIRLQPLGDGTRVRALNGRGVQVASDSIPPGREAVDVVLTGPGIVTVQLAGGSFEVGVEQVCWGVGSHQGGEDGTTGEFPVVSGTTIDGLEQVWNPTIEAKTRTAAGACFLVRYTPDKEAATWSAVRIHEWSGTGKQDAGRVGLLRLCGVSAVAAGLAQGNAAFATDLGAIINAHAASGEPARKDLLAAGRGYTVRVSWEWQGWIRSDSQQQPPSVPPAAQWNTGTTESYRFRTASTTVTGGVPPAELTDERAFDPRSMIRYLIAFEPDTRSAPHLLDDTLLVHLAVDHGDQLAQLYGRRLQLRLRRTDPPPGTLAGQSHPAGEPFQIVWGPLFDVYRPLGQKRFLDAIRTAPCLDEPAVGRHDRRDHR